jgi:hypothetical protein
VALYWAVHGKLAMDIYHGYEPWIKTKNITLKQLENIVGYVKRSIEWISLVNNQWILLFGYPKTYTYYG